MFNLRISPRAFSFPLLIFPLKRATSADKADSKSALSNRRGGNDGENNKKRRRPRCEFLEIFEAGNEASKVGKWEKMELVEGQGTEPRTASS
jgi:hypothetical protein